MIILICYNFINLFTYSLSLRFQIPLRTIQFNWFKWCEVCFCYLLFHFALPLMLYIFWVVLSSHHRNVDASHLLLYYMKQLWWQEGEQALLADGWGMNCLFWEVVIAVFFSIEVMVYHYNANGHGETLSYNRLRQMGLIIFQWDSSSGGFHSWDFIEGFFL